MAFVLLPLIWKLVSSSRMLMDVCRVLVVNNTNTNSNTNNNKMLLLELLRNEGLIQFQKIHMFWV
jgi:hypothetical protein